MTTWGLGAEGKAATFMPSSGGAGEGGANLLG